MQNPPALIPDLSDSLADSLEEVYNISPKQLSRNGSQVTVNVAVNHIFSSPYKFNTNNKRVKNKEKKI